MTLRVRQLEVRLPLDPPRTLQVDALDLQGGQWVALVGANGSGKSTLLRSLATTPGLVRPRNALTEFVLDGRAIQDWDARSRAQRISWLPQTGGESDGALTVAQTVMIGRAPWLGLLQPPGDRDRRAVDNALRQVDVHALRDRALSSLSGGERQRALIARVLATEAQLMLLDEPLAHLDAPHQQALLRVIRSRCDQGACALIVVHDLNIALQADAVIVLFEGRAHPARSVHDRALHRDLERSCGGAIEVLPHPGGAGWIALPRRNY